MFPTLNNQFASLVFPDDIKQTGLTQGELDQWNRMSSEISEWWLWFTGEKLREQLGNKPGKDGQYPLKYPLQINLPRMAARLHAYALKGQVKDTSEPIVRCVVEPRAGKKFAKEAQYATEVLGQISYENNARSMFTDMFLAVQALGAMVIKVGWSPTLTRPTGIRWEYIDPRYCFFRWESTDYLELTEAWVRYTISAAQAAQIGVQLKGKSGVYLEHWTKDIYEIKVSGEFAVDQDGPVKRRNPFGFVPFVYIPHERANDFWGASLVPSAIGLTKEINARAADMGDAVQKGVHRKKWGRNIRNGFPQEQDLPRGDSFLNLGKTISASDPQPEIGLVDSPDMPAGFLDFLHTMTELAEFSMITPPAAYGVQEASQRSGQSMSTRLWSMLSHVIDERTHWTVALNRVCEMSLSILAKHKREGITQEHLGLPKRQDWNPMVPIDRAALILELMQRWQAGTIGLETLLEKCADIPDIEEEVKAIKAQQAQLMTQQQAQLQNTVKQAEHQS